MPFHALGCFCLQVLTCTEDMMQQRVEFLLSQGLSQVEVGRAVLAHPQVRPLLSPASLFLSVLVRLASGTAAVGACCAALPWWLAGWGWLQP